MLQQKKPDVTNLVVRIVIFKAHLGHGLGNGLEGLDNVAKDDGLEVESLVLVEALRIDELHLLQDGRFP